MKVVIGAESLFGPLTGIGHYTRHLVLELQKRGDIEDLMLLAYGKLVHPGKAASLDLSSAHQQAGRKKRYIYTAANSIKTAAAKNQAMVSLFSRVYPLASRWSLRHYGPEDIFHSPNYILPPFPGRRLVTIADLSTLKHPEFHNPSTTRLLNKHIRQAVTCADHILTISNYVKDEIVEYFDIPATRISTTHLGVSEQFHPREKESCDRVLSRIDAPHKEFFLFVSTIEPRKNLSRLLDAYQSYHQREGAAALPLVVAGLPGWMSDDVHALLNKLQSQGVVRYLGYVSQNDIPLLFSAARALLFPSLYEGLGLPVLEAMKSGTSVMTSRNSAMQEIAGPAACYIDPHSVEQMSTVLSDLTHNECMVNDLVREGIIQAKQYTWERCCEATMAAYLAAGKE